MYVCMSVFLVCLYVLFYVFLNASIDECMYVRMSGLYVFISVVLFMYVCLSAMYELIHVCLYVCLSICVSECIHVMCVL